jgi:integrase
VARKQGSIYIQKLKSGKKVWKVEVETGKKPDGTRIRKRMTASSLQEAREMHRELLDQAGSGIQAAQSKQRLDVFAFWWIREVKTWTVKAATAADYEHRYRKHISPVLGQRKIESITSKDIYSWRASLKKASYSTPTINGALQVLKAVLDATFDEGAIRLSPAKKLGKLTKPISEATQVREALTRVEAKQLFAACTDDALGVSVALGLILGLRKGEILGLRWRDVDMENQKILVRRTLREVTTYDDAGRGHTSLLEDTPKTRASTRELVVPQPLWRLLNMRNIDFVVGRPDCSDKWVVGDLEGNPLTPTELGKGFNALLAKAAVRKIRFHDLRHSAATLSVAAGARLEAVSQSLGHTRVDTTKSIYARTVNELSSEFSGVIEEIFETHKAPL